jgi:hypothetical protein
MPQYSVLNVNGKHMKLETNYVQELRKQTLTYEDSKQLRIGIVNRSYRDGYLYAGFDTIDMSICNSDHSKFLMAWSSVLRQDNIKGIWAYVFENHLNYKHAEYKMSIEGRTRCRIVNVYAVQAQDWNSGREQMVKKVLSDNGIGDKFDYNNEQYLATKVYILLDCDRYLLERGSGLFRDRDHRARILQLLTEK